MLIHLKIKNIVLVDSAKISFEKGLNIITGETGAGKSAILSAIRLVTGSRAETELVGKNGDIAVVEALLSSYFLPEEIAPPPPGEPLLIRREIHRSGKNRCFAADQQISLSLLRLIVGESIEIIDQSSSHLLSSIEEQRRILDTYSGNLDLVKEVAFMFNERQSLQKKIDTLLHETLTKERDLSWAQEDLQSIQETNWNQGEEEELVQKHSDLILAQELGEKMRSALDLLESSPIRQAASILDRCPPLDSLAKTLKNALLEIDEVEQTLHSHISSQEFDPNALLKTEGRMTKIDQLKRSHGKTWEEIQEKKNALILKVNRLENLDQELEDLKRLLHKKEENVRSKAKDLSIRRQQGILLLTQSIIETLQTLNLPSAQFVIPIQEAPLSAHGTDGIRFLFSANAGHLPAPVEECASGGELSRLLFSLKVALAAKEKNDCLIFDEIDANVGGLTATVLGEKLKKIAKQKQVICVTHFVQVARFAEKHFVVTKNETNGKTITHITELGKGDKTLEYERMLGSPGALQR